MASRDEHGRTVARPVAVCCICAKTPEEHLEVDYPESDEVVRCENYGACGAVKPCTQILDDYAHALATDICARMLSVLQLHLSRMGLYTRPGATTATTTQ